MTFLFADPSLRREVGSNASLYQYLLPELVRYGVHPLLCCHQKASPTLIERMSAQPLFRYAADDACVGVQTRLPHGVSVRDHTIADAMLEDLQSIRGLGTSDCLYFSDCGLTQLLAVVRWLESFAESSRPKTIVHLSAKGTEISPSSSGEAPAGSESQGTELTSLELTDTLAAADPAFLKLICYEGGTTRYFSKLFRTSIEEWPKLQRASTAYRQRGAGTLTISILGHQTREKGYGLIPQFAASLLQSRPEVAILIHNNAPQDAADEQEQLRAIARSNSRLILCESLLGSDIWSQFLDSTDLMLLLGHPGLRQAGLLNEAIANGIPVVAAADLLPSEEHRQFASHIRTFERNQREAMFGAVNDVLSDFAAFAKAAAGAREAWNEKHGARLVVPRILKWLSDTQVAGGPVNKEPVVQKTSARPPARTTRPKRVLLSWYCDPSYIPPPILSDDQVTVGPHPLATSNTYLSPNQRKAFDAYTPYKAAYDLKETLRVQGITGPFDLVAVFAESTLNNLPANVDAFGCPTVLLLGDTHHGEKCLQNMLRYALSVQFDYVASTYNRQHLHWLVEAGIRRVGWIPALAAEHTPQQAPARRENRLAFIGQKGALHARRGRLLDALHTGGVKVEPKVVSRTAAAALYSSSTLSFNASLNGDLNLRTFEVMSAGGCLIADRLSAEAGQSLLFEEGRDYLGYSSATELIDCVQEYLGKPSEAQKVAEAGHKTYIERYGPEQQAAALRGWIFDGKLPAEYRSGWDTRSTISALNPLAWHERLPLYEELQEAHRVKEAVRVLVSPNVPLSVATDMLDLPRLECSLLSLAESTAATLKEHGLWGRFKKVGSTAEASRLNRWDYLITRTDDPQSMRAITHDRHIEVESIEATQHDTSKQKQPSTCANAERWQRNWKPFAHST